ncbi:MAG: hypothetical protein QXQ81_01090 [Candidatus Thorarchaeota archaeon]
MKTGRLGTTIPVLLIILFIMFPWIVVTDSVHTTEPDREPTSDAISARVLIDESHCANGSSLWTPGNLSLFGWILQQNGHVVTTNLATSLDSGILQDYDVVVLFYPAVNLTAGEFDAIRAFVESGRGLVLVGTDNENWWKLRPDYLNTISRGYGIEFNQDRVTADVTDLAVHPINHQVSVLHTRGIQLDGCTLTLSGAAAYIAAVPTGPVAAVTEAGAGKIVAVGTPAPFYMYRMLDPSASRAHFQFALNIIDWLASNSPRTVNEPEYAIIRVKSGPTLSAEDLERYKLYVGLYHDHTTHSDGANSAARMLEAGLEKGLDFMILTDHSHLQPNTISGVYGAMEARSIAEKYGLDCLQVIGAELSSVKHTAGFPLNENIWTNNQSEAVIRIHEQGGIAILCHPTMEYSYGEVFSRMNELNYDAFEVDNSGYIFGSGEDALIWPFMGACDSHSASHVGDVLNALFVENPSGQEGQLADEDIKNAVLTRQLVVLDQLNKIILGDKTWVDRLVEMWDNAKNDITQTENLLTQIESTGQKVTMSRYYLDSARTSLEHMSIGRAGRLLGNATSELVLGLDIGIETIEIGEPWSSIPIVIRLANNHSAPVVLNTTVYPLGEVVIDPINQIINASAKSVTTETRTMQTGNYGYLNFWLNVMSLSDEYTLIPIFISSRGLIDHVTHTITPVGDSFQVEFQFWIGRQNTKTVIDASLFYDTGSGWTMAKMEESWNYFFARVGQLQAGMKIRYRVVVVTESGVFTLRERLAEIPGTSPDLGIIGLVVAVGALGLVTVLGVWRMRIRRN